MPRFEVREFDWQPELADHRDQTPAHPAIAALFRKIGPRVERVRSAGAPLDLPTSVDWRDYCGPVEDQLGLPTSSAHACLGLVQLLERRSSGRLLRLSRLFSHRTAARFTLGSPSPGASLRAVFKGIVHCGVPPEKFWPYEPTRLEAEPDSFAYSFQRSFRTARYVRLDQREMTGDEVMRQVRAFLAAGFPCVFGFPVTSSLGGEAEIPFPTAADTVLGGQAVVAVGYDDKVRIRSDKGALIIRNSWGASWGDGGYGWLPYSFVRQRLASNFWTLLKPSWLRSGEFEVPRSQ